MPFPNIQKYLVSYNSEILPLYGQTKTICFLGGGVGVGTANRVQVMWYISEATRKLQHHPLTGKGCLVSFLPFFSLFSVDSKSVKDMDGVTGTVPNDRSGNGDETEEKSRQNDFQSGSPLSSGVDNPGFLDFCETESGRCYPDQVKLEPVEVNLNDSQSVGVNCKPSTNSDDPESPRSSTSAPTMTLRTWLKNPHLYKVFLL